VSKQKNKDKKKINSVYKNRKETQQWVDLNGRVGMDEKERRKQGGKRRRG
jgi:hypothetical protein